MHYGQSKKRVFAVFLLWLMAFGHFYTITRFSARAADVSSAESSGILDNILENILGEKKETMDAECYDQIHILFRKTAHFISFFVLGFLYIMLAAVQYETLDKQLVTAVLICGLSAAILDEGHQYFVPGRGPSIKDVCIDFSGIITGSMLFIYLKKVFKC